MGNGDFIALYDGGNLKGADFPVVYLDHDGCGETKLLAPSFDEFLNAWEKLYYIQAGLLRGYFTDPVRGTINPESPKKACLDDLFRLGKESKGAIR
jgi:hypothetical protein